MTDEVWEWLLADGPWPSDPPMRREQADALKHEYEYFYPFDIRSSAKDLIPNHLTFCLYSHTALLPENKWPLSIRANGYLMLNGKKMSKSTGNSLTLRDGVDKFGADAMRLTLADAGDGIEDANFEEKTANANILRVHTLLSWCEVSFTGYHRLLLITHPRRTWLQNLRNYDVAPGTITTVYSKKRSRTSSIPRNAITKRVYFLSNTTEICADVPSRTLQHQLQRCPEVRFLRVPNCP